MKVVNGVYTSAKIFTNTIEEYAVSQIQMLCDNPAFQDSQIRIMPDVHPGKVGTIGFTATVGDRILPNVVGVDIGCGITLAKLKQKKTEFQRLDKVIRENIPSGFVIRQKKHHRSEEFDFSELYCAKHASLQVTAIIIGQYSKARGFWDDYQIAFFLNRSEEILIGEIRRMEARAKRRDKAELVREAFTDSIKKGLLVPIVLNHETSGGKYDVYENEKYYFARARKLRCLTNEYARINQEHVEIVNDDELIGLLERLNLLEVYERKDGSISRSRKLPIQKGNALCYLYVKKEKIWESKAL